ncbi:MAG: hypothetical protein ABSH20_04985 [Tepidisphaeraceae bacterium]|jgi:hypothetical protein
MVVATRFRSVLLVGIGILLQGCIAIYGHRDVTVQVMDAETGKPISSASVTVSPSGAMLTYNLPATVMAQTDSAGMAVMRLAKWDRLDWSVLRPGYLHPEGTTRFDVEGQEAGGDSALW